MRLSGWLAAVLFAFFAIVLAPQSALAATLPGSTYDAVTCSYDAHVMSSSDTVAPLERASPPAPGAVSWGSAVVVCGDVVAANTADEIPAVIYRGGGKSPSNFRLREGEDALSFRDSLSDPISPGSPVMHPGRDWVGLDTSKLPPGSVVPDGVPGSAVTPPGHVSVYVDDPMLLKEAIIEFGKFPK